MRNFLAATGLLLACNLACAANTEPWRSNAKCAIAKRGSDGLVPDALAELQKLGLVHRITQTLNLSTDTQNYHGTDTVVYGKPVTAAVDISVRCLDETEIKDLLSALSSAGFAAWYRKGGSDSWTGATHVHAVWAREPLKQQLRAQVHSWYEGKTGLVGDRPYEFWRASGAQRDRLLEAFESSRSRPVGGAADKSPTKD